MKILVIKLGAIGDLIQTTPALRSIRKWKPNSKIAFLASNWSMEIAQCLPHVNEVFSFIGAGEFSMRNTYNSLSNFLKLRKEKFDIAIVFNRNKAMNLIARLLGKESVGFNYKEHGKFLKFKVSYDEKKHEIDRYFDVIKAIGIEANGIYPEIKFDEKEIKFMREYLKKEHKIKEKEKIAVIHVGGGENPGTYMPIKRWGSKNCASLADKLLEKGLKVIFVGSKNDHRSFLQIMNSMSNKNFIDLVGKTTLSELISIFSCASIFIGIDSGPLYIAAASGIPTISIFGPSNPFLVAPRGEKHKFIWKKIDCSPCYTPESVWKNNDFSVCKKNNECMNLVTVEDVWGHMGSGL